VFEAVLRELGVRVPSRQEAARTLAPVVSRLVVDGSLAPDQGARRLVALARETDPVSEDLSVFVGLLSELEDFSDTTRLAYYGEAHCRMVRGQLEHAITEAASRVAGR
jgi:hypothetical protein